MDAIENRMRETRHNEKYVDYKPLAAPDYREKDFKFAGCSIVVAAMKRWPALVDRYAGSWEDYLRSQYCREARLQDALVVNLGTGECLTDEEVRATDPYCLAVLYEDGSYSKTFEEPRVDKSKVMRVYEKPDGLGKQSKKTTIQPSSENIVDEFRFHGSPCRRCGGTLRYIKSRECVPCAKAASDRHESKRRDAISVP